ncbi:hypothetical protein [Paraflavitalea sp. CAU 1676]|uniref:hypothetical protein n=1 Tax=Paraflavitalea sp. CAU 1676 TaxID=3032598 RepID=UPI0023DBB9A9|nr:hypothetical protein [Paraflavitalea sp. CAU 1676]MDF2189154.1 hypothetical protein [Paraflavitalea sp. CAU 1676]
MATNLIDAANNYRKLYDYLSVMNEKQIIKLMKIAVGILPLQAFSKEEIDLLQGVSTMTIQ